MIRSKEKLALAIGLVIPNLVFAQFESDIHAWVTQDARNPPPKESVLFIGDSTIRAWESLTRDFNDYNIIQRGFGSAAVSDLVRYIDEIILSYDPSAIVVSNRSSISRNDLAAQQHVDFFELIHARQRQDRPPIPIFYVSEFPRLTTLTSRWPNEDEPRNAILKEYANATENVYFIDTATRMWESAEIPGGAPSEFLFATDRHHHNEQGYEYWHVPIQEAVESIVTPNKVFELNAERPIDDDRILVDFGRVATDSPDGNGNHWNSWHTDSSSSILAGQSLGNLVTTDGRESGVDLIITGEFDALDSRASGLLEPDAELLGDFAIESATQDAFARGSLATSIGVPNAGFMLDGLDPAAEYDLRFFGTLRSSRNRTARYSVVGAGDPIVKDFLLATSDSGQNTNTILEYPRIQPDRYGQIFVDLQAVDGRHDGYLNIMELRVTTSLLIGDFDGDNTLTTADIDMLANAIRNGSNDTRFDLDDDAAVDQADHRRWVTELKQTWYGDANLDGEFNSGDLVSVFQAGQHEDGIAMNSGWADGDWNGDGEFDTSDFVLALQDGGYEQGLRPLAVAVPEPASNMAFWCSLGLLFVRRRPSFCKPKE
ncbi:MAG: hypothetical protein KDB27_13305 [Planctomycetales bacterium]|nr:hypothetical protein [Planctomycetales bacterium]